jgi:hypothetical protein
VPGCGGAAKSIVLLGISVQTAPSRSSTAPYKDACCQGVSALAVLLPFILLSVCCLVVFQSVTHHATMPPPYSHSCWHTRTRGLCPDLRFACKTEHGSCGSNSVLKCKIQRGSSVVRVRSDGSNSRFDSSGGVAGCDWARLILSGVWSIELWQARDRFRICNSSEKRERVARCWTVARLSAMEID